MPLEIEVSLLVRISFTKPKLHLEHNSEYYVSLATYCCNNNTVQIQFIVARGRRYVDATQNNGVSVHRPFGICDIDAKIWAQLSTACTLRTVSSAERRAMVTRPARRSCHATPLQINGQ